MPNNDDFSFIKKIHFNYFISEWKQRSRPNFYRRHKILGIQKELFISPRSCKIQPKHLLARLNLDGAKLFVLDQL